MANVKTASQPAFPDLPHQQQSLRAAGRQLERTRRAEAVRLRQRAKLVKLLVESMVEFGISPAEIAAARRAIVDRADEPEHL